MIDIKELRIGSYVYINNKIERVELVDIEELSLALRYGRDIEFIRPILLSQTILQKIGFKRVTETTSDDLYSNGSVYLKVVGNSVSLYSIDSAKILGASFSYLHQLQNILSSLFHIELVIE